MHLITRQIAAEIKVTEHQVRAAIELLDGGATVPFIARYRKEATGGLDDIQLRELAHRLDYLRELEARREAVLKSIQEQGKLTPELQAALMDAVTKQALEDLYLPFKPKRRTKGMIAREAGLEPLADALFANPQQVPADAAQAYLQPAGSVEGADFSTVAAVLDGVRDILSERWAEDASLVQNLREWLWQEGLFRSKLASGKDENNPMWPSFVTTSIMTNPCVVCPRTGHWPFFVDARSKFWMPSWRCPSSPNPDNPARPRAGWPCTSGGVTKLALPMI